jgi:hypothetical protein
LMIVLCRIGDTIRVLCHVCGLVASLCTHHQLRFYALER